MFGVPQRKRKTTDKIKPQILAKALKATRCGVLITQPTISDNPIIHANRSFCEMTGYTREEILGKNCRFLQGTDQRQSEVSIIREAISAHRSCTVTLRNYKKSGELFYNELTISPILDKNKNLTHFVGIQKDVTSEVLLRTQKDEFLATLLYDIKAPLLASIRLLNLIKSSEYSNENAPLLLEDVLQNDYSLSRLIDNAIDSYRPNQQIDLKCSYYDVTQQFLKCSEQLGSIAQHKKISVVLPTESLVICADSRLLERALSNILELAMHFAPPGGRVKVSAIISGENIELEFSNRSSSLPVKYFTAVQNLLLSFEDGNSTSLALYSSKRILQRHGGDLLVKRENKVTSFILQLPVRGPTKSHQGAT